MARSLGPICKAFQRIGSLSSIQSQLSPPSTRIPFRTSSRGMLQGPSSAFFSRPRDFSLPNSSWGPEMMRLYEQYNSQCEEEMEGGEKREGPWQRLPSYNRFLKYATGGVYLSRMIHKKARLFTRNNRDQGATFEYVLFFNSEEDKCVGIFQAGHLLEGPPGPVPLGNTVLLESSLDKKEGKKVFVTCKMTSGDGSKLHTDSTALFVSIKVSQLLMGS
ncbi:acyl-coenzyme A thioesterase THEM4 isoform X3 [Pungitius pungitius]|uniref:acyl-coenzyme A thioesterase THEM4 isoform X3 n=1 Tax=Pungitius pungitius TaxID=134920 RepID=UPI001886C623|nr:acyl-coenzyme A thioesterase THEM4 isoform X3 [Pungitius pungitius]